MNAIADGDVERQMSLASGFANESETAVILLYSDLPNQKCLPLRIAGHFSLPLAVRPVRSVDRILFLPASLVPTRAHSQRRSASAHAHRRASTLE